jgi:hypothetical protein
MKVHPRQWSCYAIIIIIGLLVSACGAGRWLSSAKQVENSRAAFPLATPSRTPFQPSPPTDLQASSSETVEAESQLPADPVNGPQATPKVIPPDDPVGAPGIYLADYLPEAIRQALVLPAGYELSSERNEAHLQFEVGEQNPFSRWIYTLVAPFPTILEGVSSSELKGVWQGGTSVSFPGVPLLMDPQTYAVFVAAWGPSAANAVEVLPTGDLVTHAWEHRPAWGIIPFEAIEPRWKVLEVDGISPIQKEFAPDTYSLSVTFSMNLVGEASPTLSADILSLSPAIPISNRAGNKLTTLAMTGVTALVRCTAYYMEQRGITYPGQDVRELLRDADITHVSNEIPFAKGCPFPSCFQEGLVFCSDPKYIELLIDIGTDIVELTGDHFADWGPEAMLYTLDLYQEYGLPYYGGGIDWDEGSRAVVLEHNGNRLAFIGCNGKGGWYATARADNPGAVSCDFETMHAEINRLRAEGYLPIATFQHFEYYTYLPQPNMVADFRGMAEAGAVIVSGSQAHQPHGMEIFGDSFLHYGLGNLFFDQFGYCPDRACDDAFIDQHVFYDGRYIATELIPIKFVDWARPRLMTADEREEFLQIIFSASGW